MWLLLVLGRVGRVVASVVGVVELVGVVAADSSLGSVGSSVPEECLLLFPEGTSVGSGRLGGGSWALGLRRIPGGPRSETPLCPPRLFHLFPSLFPTFSFFTFPLVIITSSLILLLFSSSFPSTSSFIAAISSVSVPAIASSSSWSCDQPTYKVKLRAS